MKQTLRYRIYVKALSFALIVAGAIMAVPGVLGAGEMTESIDLIWAIFPLMIAFALISMMMGFFVGRR